MGAWGHGSFANDSALDWLQDLLEDGPPLVREALDRISTAGDQTYLDADDCCAALAAAELVAAALGHGDDRLEENALAWLQENRDATREVGANRAERAVARVYQKSELRDLWDENGPDTEWHADVRELLRRLSG